jgi:multiple sugar transport system substrate-binding protein
MKKVMLLITISIIVISSVFASGSSEEEKKGVTLKFWYTYGENEEAILLNEVIPMWEEANPDIKIDCVRQDGSQYHQMIVTSFGTGNSPDVARIEITKTAAYANQGGLTALSDYPEFNNLKKNFLEGPLSTNSFRGSYYGLPLDTNCKVAVVNTKILKDELNLDKVPKTMEEFIEKAKNRDKYSINVSGFGDWDLYPYFWLFGGVLTNDDFTKASGYFNSPQSVNAIKKMIELHDMGIFTIRDLDGSVDAWDGIESEYAMFFEGPWYNFNAKADLGIVPSLIPTYEGRSATVVGGENIAVFSTSKYQEEAWKFAQFMTSEKVQAAMLKSGQLPVLKDMVTSSAVLENPIWSVYMKQLESAKARIPSPYTGDIENVFKNCMTSIFVDSANVQDQMDKAAIELDQILSK